MSSLDGIEDRIKRIEQRISSKDHVDGDLKILPVIKNVDDTLNMLASKRERFKNVFKKVPEITSYLDPEFIVSEEVDVSAKKEYILLIEDEINMMAAQLEKISNLRSTLDSSAISAYATHDKKLKQINIKLFEQMNEANTVDENLLLLVSKYNEMVQCLSEHFVYLDQLLVKLEEEKSRSS